MKQLPKRLRALRDHAHEMGTREILIDMNRPHPKMTGIRPDGIRIKLTLANTPSDWRSDRNALAKLRRLVLGVEPPIGGVAP